jgi:predicted aminopeptidase
MKLDRIQRAHLLQPRADLPTTPATAATQTSDAYVVWNVFAAPEFSVTPRRWCFPFAGCVGYKGYFKQAGG